MKIFEAVLISKFLSRNHEWSKNQNDINFYSNLTNLACFELSCKSQAYPCTWSFEGKLKWNLGILILKTDSLKVTGQTL